LDAIVSMLTISRRRAGWAAAAGFLAAGAAHADLPPRAAVAGPEITQAEVADAKSPRAWRATAWSDLSTTSLAPGAYLLRVKAPAGAEAVEWPVCAGRGRILVDGGPTPPPASPAPAVVRLDKGTEHTVTVEIAVSGYERRIACGQPPRQGATKATAEGVGAIAFTSPRAAAGGGRAAYFVPPGHDPKKPAALLVGAHPWNGSIWTYSAYAELVREAARRDVLLLMPSGLGNSLYTASAEEEVMLAIDAFSANVAVDPRRVSIWGASMGGAGATTIAFHRPDRFAFAASFFGDSKYDVSTYVRSILPSEEAAHLVNALDVVENARHLPVWLVHGEEDRVSPIEQSALLHRAMIARNFTVRFDHAPRMGHEGALVARNLAEVVDRAADARAPERPARVTYRSVRPGDVGAYGVRITRELATGDAFVDVERRADGVVHVQRASNVRAITLARGALGAASATPPAIVVDPGAGSVSAAWESAP
jgi:dienelactone hydrolase